MNTKGNSIAFASFMVFLLIMLALTPSAQGITFRENVTGHAYIHSDTSVYELTVPAAQVSNYADMFDFQKGAHYTMAVSEGTSIHLSVIVTNNRPNQITVEGYAAIRVKPTPDESWSTIWSDTATNTVNSGSSATNSSDPTDLTAYGWWQDGCQLHFCIGLKIYPTTDPSDWTYSAFSIWFVVGTSATPTPPTDGDGAPSEDEGDGTTTGETPTDYDYGQFLAFLDPLATSLNLTRLELIMILLLLFACVCVVGLHMLTKEY